MCPKPVGSDQIARVLQEVHADIERAFGAQSGETVLGRPEGPFPQSPSRHMLAEAAVRFADLDPREMTRLNRAAELLRRIKEGTPTNPLPDDSLQNLRQIMTYLNDPNPNNVVVGLVLLEVFYMVHFERRGQYYRILGEFRRLTASDFDVSAFGESVRSTLDRMRERVILDQVDERRFAAAVPMEMAPDRNEHNAALNKFLFLLVANGETELFRIFVDMIEPAYIPGMYESQLTQEQRDAMLPAVFVAASRELTPRHRELIKDAFGIISGSNFREDSAFKEYYGIVIACTLLHLSRREPVTDIPLESEFSHAMSALTYRKGDRRSALTAVRALADPRVPYEVLSTARDMDLFKTWHREHVGYKTIPPARPRRGTSEPHRRRTTHRPPTQRVPRMMLRGAARCVGSRFRTPLA